ncbi:Lysyl oxidase-domain-containing protein [Powellomyces hirtus]|nr:Lysyl oxidase-domain-containing protein [Powellomyces hirtus]
MIKNLALFLLSVAVAVTLSYAQPSTALPDFLPDALHAASTLYIDHVDAAEDPCLINEGCLTGNGTRMLLRFASKVHNIGNADAYLGKPPANRTDPNNPIYWHWDSCHEHWHFTAYANYKLLSGDLSNEILRGHKNGFCLEDLGCNDESKEPYYNCRNQGVSMGCYDMYDETLPCQWIDVTDLHRTPGYTAQTEYVLQVAINEAGFFPEGNIANNVAHIKVVIGDVPPYTGPSLAEVRRMGAPDGPEGGDGPRGGGGGVDGAGGAGTTGGASDGARMGARRLRKRKQFYRKAA